MSRWTSALLVVVALTPTSAHARGPEWKAFFAEIEAEGSDDYVAFSDVGVNENLVVDLPDGRFVGFYTPGAFAEDAPQYAPYTHMFLARDKGGTIEVVTQRPVGQFVSHGDVTVKIEALAVGDFDLDGRDEVAVSIDMKPDADASCSEGPETLYWILDAGKDELNLAFEGKLAQNLLGERTKHYPYIVDVDVDGHPDIVMVGEECDGDPDTNETDPTTCRTTTYVHKWNAGTESWGD